MKRVIIAPHVDDDVLGCGGILDVTCLVVYCGIDESGIPDRPSLKERLEEVQAVKDITGHKTKILKNLVNQYKEKDLIGVPWLLAFALRADGWYLRQDIIWSKPNPMPESVRDRCTKSHEYIFLFSKNQNYYFDVDAIKEPTVDGKGLKRKKSVWNIKTKPYKDAHFSVFPEELIKPCILAGSEEGDLILDPFIGSGTTAVTAKSLNRDYIGCELNQDYAKLISKKIYG